jgi:hypothetical protein
LADVTQVVLDTRELAIKRITTNNDSQDLEYSIETLENDHGLGSALRIVYNAGAGMVLSSRSL